MEGLLAAPGGLSFRYRDVVKSFFRQSCEFICQNEDRNIIRCRPKNRIQRQKPQIAHRCFGKRNLQGRTRLKRRLAARLFSLFAHL